MSAIDRVTTFLNELEARAAKPKSGVDPELIHSLGTSDGILHLTASDLRALLATHEHTANEEARHGNRDALEAMTRERDRLREALEAALEEISGMKPTPSLVAVALTARAALEDEQ